MSSITKISSLPRSSSSAAKSSTKNSNMSTTSFSLPKALTISQSPDSYSSSSSASSGNKSKSFMEPFAPSSSSKSTAASSSTATTKYSYYHLTIIVVILLFVGVNVFFYLGAITQYLRDLFAPLLADVLRSLGYVVTSTASTAASTAATGAKTGVDVASGSVISGIGVLQGQLDTVAATSQHDGTGISTRSVNNEVGDVNDKGLTSALNHAAAESTDNTSMYLSRNGEANFTGKNGYCYVGEDRGFRSCVSVKPDDTCMSGDIFPSMDICINPSLRE
jgi:hypothetical protein